MESICRTHQLTEIATKNSDLFSAKYLVLAPKVSDMRKVFVVVSLIVRFRNGVVDHVGQTAPLGCERRRRPGPTRPASPGV